jgi:hypothetical protein
MKSKSNHLSTAVIKTIALLLISLSKSNIYAQSSDHSSINIGLIYPLSSNYTSAPRDTNKFSLNLIAGVSAAVHGFSIAGFSNVVTGDAKGLQIAGFSNHVGKNADGLMVAGFINTYTKGHGTAVAGFTNIAHDSSNVQIAGFLNIGGDVAALQVAGFMNKAKKQKGIQVGFINIADSAATQVGIINIAKNDEKSIGVSIDDIETTMVTLRSGGNRFYGIIGLGYNVKNTKEKYAFEAGLGANLLREKAFSLKTELISSGLESFKGDEYYKSSFYLMPAFKITRFIEIFAGPSFNYIETDNPEGKALVKTYVRTWDSNDDNHLKGLYFGYTAGIQFYF